MTPPVQKPPCPSCEGFNRLAGDEAALADLDRVAGETRAPTANEAPRPGSARPAETSSPNARPNADAPSPRGTEARPRMETAREAPRSPAGSEARAGERTAYTGQAPRSEFARPSVPQNL
ncbi:MAG: hypothetical protein K8R69_05110, partial [Deltaproteobacteria bacterium]|nr:hypothetical protein [Deltaproteobacteria bacterium]